MSADRIDVLAVIDRLIGNTRTMCGLLGDPRMREHLREGEKARAAVAELIAAHREVLRYVATTAVGCHGDKCREPWCYSCFGEEEADEAAARGAAAYRAGHAAITRVGGAA